MIQLTRIFNFEIAHAIHGYPGACKNIHGHSYELHVTVSSKDHRDNFIAAPGFIINFKQIKKIVTSAVIEKFDHKVVLSHSFLVQNPSFLSPENLVTWQAEPTAENMLIFIKEVLIKKFPDNVKLVKLKLFETKDSYAEWVNEKIFISSSVQ
jgi:6-pyruvoyltetrahydropterin/6-carboxytetrahydropterin synthase